MKSGRAIPPKLLEPPPEVALGLELYMQCFWDLAADRGSSNRISWTSIELWANAQGLDREMAFDLHFLVNKLDLAYIEWADKAAKLRRQDKKRDPRAV